MISDNEEYSNEIIKDKEFLDNFVNKCAIDMTNKALWNEKIEIANEKYDELFDVYSKQLERKVKKQSYLVFDTFGFAILDMIRKAMKLRIEEPQKLTFIHTCLNEHLDMFGLPPMYVNGVKLCMISVDNYFFHKELNMLFHLWALVLQENQNRNEIVCGNNLFGVHCPYKSYHSKCTTLLNKTINYGVDCDFSKVLIKFKLGRIEDEK